MPHDTCLGLGLRVKVKVYGLGFRLEILKQRAASLGIICTLRPQSNSLWLHSYVGIGSMGVTMLSMDPPSALNPGDYMAPNSGYLGPSLIEGRRRV